MSYVSKRQDEHYALGHYHDLTVRLFGKDSPATQWIDAKMKRSDAGWNEPVMADEAQMLYLLSKLHTCATRQEGPNDEGNAADVEHAA